MKILAIDSTSDACSVALVNDTEIIERSEIVPRKHTEIILPMVDEVLTESGLSLNQLDALAFNRGPGSFTGVRISTSVAQGLAYAVDLPVVPVSGLATVAHGAWRTTQQDNILVLLDARMHEVYWAYYQNQIDGLKLIGDEHVTHVSDIRKPAEGHWQLVGSGVKVYNGEITAWAEGTNVTITMESYHPHARDVAELAKLEFEAGDSVTAMEAQPVYIRDKVV